MPIESSFSNPSYLSQPSRALSLSSPLSFSLYKYIPPFPLSLLTPNTPRERDKLNSSRMEHDGKKAAKAFVDKYFPVKQPTNPQRLPDVLSDLFPHQELKKQGQSSSSQTTAAESSSQGRASKSGAGGSPKKGNAVVFCEVSEPCSMSSSVDYGCRDNYYPDSSGSYHDKDRKDGYEYQDPKHSRGEWWQGSLYY